MPDTRAQAIKRLNAFLWKYAQEHPEKAARVLALLVPTLPGMYGR